MKKEAHFQIKGISQDLAYQLFNPQYAFEMRNIRLSTTEEGSLLSMTNEKGNSYMGQLITDDGNTVTLTVLGTGVFSDYCIIFATTTSGSTAGDDYILCVKSDGNVYEYYKGNLGFSDSNPIRTICVYENEDVQKVYWIDGINVPRVANVAPSAVADESRDLKHHQKFDFLPAIDFDNHNEEVTITKQSGGQFPSGVIQYAFTYSDKNLQETNIVYRSPLFYSTQSNRGASAETTCNVAFKLDIKNPDVRFDYIQLYVIVRTSLNAKPGVYRIANIPVSVDSNNKLTYTDNGTGWETYSPEELIGKQLSTFIPKIIASKDSTLFLGNYTITSPYVAPTDLSTFKSGINVLMQYEDLNLAGGDYPFNLQKGSEGVKTFRNGEWYRLGIQFQDENGAISNVVYLKDVTSEMTDDYEFKRKVLKATIGNVTGIPSKFKRMRLMMVNRESLPKRIICQGVLCPTVYKVNDRVNNQPFAMSSWNMRPFQTDAFVDGTMTLPTEAGAQWMTDMPILPNTVIKGGEVINQLDTPRGVKIKADGTFDGDASMLIDTASQTAIRYHYIADAYIYWYGEPDMRRWKVIIGFGRTTSDSVDNESGCEERFIKHSSPAFYLYAVEDAARAKGWDIYTPSGLKSYTTHWMIELLSQQSDVSYPEVIVNRIMEQWSTGDPFSNPHVEVMSFTLLQHGITAGRDTIVDDAIYNTFDDAVNQASNIPYFFCDHNILTFHSPDVEANQSLIDNNSDIKYRIVGYTMVTKSMFDTYLTIAKGPSTSAEGDGVQSVKKSSLNGIYNTGLWKDTGTTFATYLWHRSLSLGSQVSSTEGMIPGSFSRKVFSNVHYCAKSFTFSNAYESPRTLYPGTGYTEFPAMGTPRVFNSNEISALSLDRQPNGTCIHNKLIYYGNVSMAHSAGTYRVPKMKEGKITNDEGDYISDSAIIRYKSTPHVVMPMSYHDYNDKKWAPSLPIPNSFRTDGPKNWSYRTNGNSARGYMWATAAHEFWRNTVDMNYDGQESAKNYDGLLYIAELYQDLSANQIYGDTSEENLSKHTWVPISDWKPIKAGNSLLGYGDTFIGRWDCLKTYSFSEDDNQSYVDVTSFIVESDINLESRYDNYKGISDATMVNPTNFNLFNPVYNQVDNFFQYSYVTSDEALDNFQNQACWSEVKTLGEELDTWAQINVGNNIDFQGEYGQLRAAANLANNLYFFQDNAVYKLNYNTRVAISPSDGVPIQISNNYRVDPPLLIKQHCGTTSQDKIIVTPNFLYFHDRNRGRLFTINSRDEINDLSGEKGVNSLLSKLGDTDKLFYDPMVKDVYLNFNAASLAFNEDLMEFTSLYDYQGITSLFSLDGKSFVTYGNGWFMQREGDYNYFFVKTTEPLDTDYKPFYIEVMANQEPLSDKTFADVEYTMVGSNDAEMSEAKDENNHPEPLDSFDVLKTTTSYQEGESNLVALRAKPSNLRRKFRQWRAEVPRATGSMDRMRDSWMKAKLIKNKPNANRYRVNNINITYLPT